MDKISLSANRLRKELKVMSHQTEQAEAEGTDSEGNLTADVRTRKSVQSMLSRKFIEVMKRYNEVQAENKKKYKEHVRRKCRIDNQDIEDEKIDEMLESGTVDSLFTGKKVNERAPSHPRPALPPAHVSSKEAVPSSWAGEPYCPVATASPAAYPRRHPQLTEAKDALHEIQDRHQDILQLEKSLLELHEMFVDMAMLIEQQGEMIDRIEFSVERSSVYVEKALQNTRQAQKLQSSARHVGLASRRPRVPPGPSVT